MATTERQQRPPRAQAVEVDGGEEEEGDDQALRGQAGLLAHRVPCLSLRFCTSGIMDTIQRRLRMIAVLLAHLLVDGGHRSKEVLANPTRDGPD